MRRTILSIAVSVVLAFGTALLSPAASAAGGDLAGTWTSVDLDGSNQTLQITGSGRHVYAMFLVDDFTTGGCGGPPAQFVGFGVVDGSELLMSGTLICLPGGNPIAGRISISFQYDAATDTLTDFSGVVWHRAS
jgi:hypothetical protein